ncbi:hypothetical protein JKA73_37215 [Myxococcus xanthus]|uniref:hypothetical protein n=1 Tax=Myxococcus xanthus TaxID=34 RepID=UPI00191776CD|nr:hypothetical protein [Myxococcus xanthus]QQR44528.1 hypothetical protein JKA73_37215 [Myxococcus xanthus]
MAPGIFEIEGQDYWTDPFKFSARVLRKFLPEGRYGLFLDTPAEADLMRVDRIPLLALYAARQQEMRIYDPWSTGHLVAVRLEDRTLDITPLFEPPEQPGLFDQDPPPSEPPGTGALAVVEQTDALRLDALQQPGHYVLTALMMDRTSNRVQLHITRPTPGGYQDEEVARFLEAMRQQPPPPEPVRYAPGEDERQFKARPDSPPAPEAPGIAVHGERVFLYEQGRPAWIRGTFQVPVLAHERVPPRPEKDDDDGYGEPRPVAIVPVFLVVIGSRTGEAEVISLRVPCFQDAPVKAGSLVTGHFEYDLFQHPAFTGKAQTNFVYAFCGEAMSGPTRMAVVTRDMLELGGRRRP